MASIRIHRNLQIVGRVQGVFFRQSALKEALDLGLTGFVENHADGSVYAEVEGRVEVVQRFVDWCKTGPPAARVAAVRVTEGVLQEFTDFQVRETA